MVDQTEREVQQELFQQALAPEPTPQETPPATPPAEPPQPPPQEPPQPQPGAEGIPSWRLREEAEARRVAEDRARTLEERLNAVAVQIQQREAQGQQPDFFADPTKATQAVVLGMLQQAFTPLVEEMRRNNEDLRRGNMARDRLVAGVLHGTEKVDKAEEAFLKARQNESLDPSDYERVVQAPNRYDEVVRWHTRQAVLSSVGDDPNAWFERQLESRMSDPQFQAQMLEKVRAGASGKPSAVKLPPSLSRATAAASGSGDGRGLSLSDADLWSHAMAPRGRTSE